MEIQALKAPCPQDLARTFPSNVWLRTSEAHHMLERVLLAYSMHNPAVSDSGHLLRCMDRVTPADWLSTAPYTQRRGETHVPPAENATAKARPAALTACGCCGCRSDTVR